MSSLWIPLWKKAPFIRLLIPIISGILLQWYFQFPLLQIILAIICFGIAFIAFELLPLSLRFNLQMLQGFLFNLMLISVGLFITYQKDIRHNNNWFASAYHDSDYIIATINEPLVQKNKSYKAECLIKNILQNTR